jgi:hypothetical protein
MPLLLTRSASVRAAAVLLLALGLASGAGAQMGHDSLQGLRTPDGGFVRFAVKQNGASVRGILQILVTPREGKGWGKEILASRYLDRSGTADTANLKPGKYRLRVRYLSKAGEKPVDALLGAPPAKSKEVELAARQVVRLEVTVP